MTTKKIEIVRNPSSEGMRFDKFFINLRFGGSRLINYQLESGFKITKKTSGFSLFEEFDQKSGGNPDLQFGQFYTFQTDVTAVEHRFDLLKSHLW